jgi:hypothetical protein
MDIAFAWTIFTFMQNCITFAYTQALGLIQISHFGWWDQNLEISISLSFVILEIV